MTRDYFLLIDGHRSNADAAAAFYAAADAAGLSYWQLSAKEPIPAARAAYDAAGGEGRVEVIPAPFGPRDTTPPPLRETLRRLWELECAAMILWRLRFLIWRIRFKNWLLDQWRRK